MAESSGEPILRFENVSVAFDGDLRRWSTFRSRRWPANRG